MSDLSLAVQVLEIVLDSGWFPVIEIIPRKTATEEETQKTAEQ